MPQKIDPRKAFYAGSSAKKRGFIRLSPFYEDEKADALFYGGYDGKTEEDMGLALIVVGGGMAVSEAPSTTTPLEASTNLEVV